MAHGSPGEAIYTPEVSAEDFPRKLIPRANETFAAPAFGSAISSIDQKYTADQATWAADQLTKFRQVAMQSLQQAKDALPAGTDPSNFSEQYLKGFDQKSTEFIAGTKAGPVASAMLTHGLQQFRDTMLDHTRAYQAQQTVAYRADAFDAHVKTSAAQVEAMPQLASQVGSTLTDEANAIGGDSSARLARMRVMDSQITLAAANGLTRQDPRGTLEALNDPSKASGHFGSVVTNLSDAQREAVRNKANEHLGDQVYSALATGSIRSAQNALLKNADLMDPKTQERLQASINAQAEHNITIADKIHEDNSKRALTDMIFKSTQGTLTQQYVNSIRGALEPAAYEYALKLASGKEVETDTKTYLDLIQARQRGDADLTSRVVSAAATGLLNKSDAGHLLESREVPQYVKDGHDYIERSAQNSLTSPDPAKGRTLANMHQDWENEVRVHPEFATDPVASQAAYKRITDKYSLIDQDRTRFGLDYPPYFPGTRMQPDIPGMKTSTFDAFQKGEINQSEFNRRAALIAQWQAVEIAAAKRKADQAKAAAQ